MNDIRKLSIAFNVDQTFRLFTDGELDYKEGILTVKGPFYFIVMSPVNSGNDPNKQAFQTNVMAVRTKDKLYMADQFSKQGSLVSSVDEGSTSTFVGFHSIYTGITSKSMIEDFDNIISGFTKQLNGTSVVTATESDLRELERQGKVLSPDFKARR